MRGVAIVAIPAQHDIVWKISSEKVPHLTLCFLGDLSNDFPIDRVAGYVEHVAETSMHRFGLGVDRRGTLGDKDADVVFFAKSRMTKWLEDIRSYFLANADIRKAYESTTQYPTWTPHLTLGYPEAPAKPLEDWEVSWVSFDRIALWTGDFEGPEFRLPDNEWGEVAMQDTIQAGADFLAHYGVKGMQWGRRRTKAQLAKGGGRTKPSADHLNVQKLTKNKRKTLTNEELSTVIKRKDLETRYSQMNPSKLKKGESIVKGVVATVGTVSSVVALASSPAGKAAATTVKTILKNLK